MNRAREIPAPLLRVDSLSVRLPAGADRRDALDQVSFEVGAGEIVCLVGASGSGKSMLANAVMGLLPAPLAPSGGRIMFQGSDLLRHSEAQMRALRGKAIGMVFQEPLSALNPLMTVGAQIAETMRVHASHAGAARAARVLELLELVGLPQVLRHAYPHRLSGGQRQRVVIAMALALEPALLIADEPTTALDMTTQAQILALIRGLQNKIGMGVLFVTHDFGVVADIADRVVVLQQGRVVEQGNVAQVLGAPRHAYTQSLLAAVPSGQRVLEVASVVAADHAAHPPGGVQSPAAAPLLEVRGLHKRYAAGTRWWRRATAAPAALDDVALQLRRGETVGVVGESGSGKSTLAKCLVRLLQPDAGQILLQGTDLAPLPAAQLRPLRQHIQMVFQDPYAALNPRHDVARTLCAAALANGVAPAEALGRARHLLAMVGLEAQALARYPAQFSGGQRQRICIARALMLAPQVLIADECVSALDVLAQAQVLALLARLQRELGIGMLFITHDLRVAAQICDRIIVMHQGRVVESGAAQQVLGAPRHPYTESLVASMPGRHRFNAPPSPPSSSEPLHVHTL